MAEINMQEPEPQSASRRRFIKGIIAAGAAASSSAYLFRSTTLLGQPSAPGAVERLIKLSAVQQGVIDEQGFQCAFCMPGFVMATTGYLKTNPNPSRQELAHGISGNLCRCQDYDKILTAMMRGAEYMRRG